MGNVVSAGMWRNLLARWERVEFLERRWLDGRGLNFWREGGLVRGSLLSCSPGSQIMRVTAPPYSALSRYHVTDS